MFGTSGDKYYSVVSWVNGTSIMDIIKKDVEKNYYQLEKKQVLSLKSCIQLAVAIRSIGRKLLKKRRRNF